MHRFTNLTQHRLWLIASLLWLASLVPAQAEEPIKLTLGGTPASFHYMSTLLTRSLSHQGYSVDITNLGNMPTTRLEVLLEQGSIDTLILGQTPARSERFLNVQVGMTDNLVNHRILFIPPDSQPQYDHVSTLDDFIALGKVAGMGQAWGDKLIWETNDLPVQGVPGDWKRLYHMVASGLRGVDYLPRGAHEIVREWPQQQELAVEQNLVFVYDRDHILYVTPTRPELHTLLDTVMKAAYQDGVIRDVANELFGEVYEPPVNLHQRRVITLVTQPG
ncbi:hypothetical protein [Saccharospirillum impatiens]|uniref:hypothetical protein n=1 Tax=Saccharospirillum impatiens TaxID=169438 RepID=UPI000429D4B1|nr:hypothetical protein [Saccharospirillum impatiens]